MVLRQYIESVRITNQSVEVTFKVAFAFFIAENEYNICYNYSKKEYRFLIDKKGNECRTTPEKHGNIENLPPFGSVGDDTETERTPNPYRIESSVVEARGIEPLSKKRSLPVSPSADASLRSLARASGVRLPRSVAPPS